jgi:phage terminase small subunit
MSKSIIANNTEVLVMPKRGPKPIPPHLKLLNGNPGKRKIEDDPGDLVKLTKLPPAPRELGKLAKKEWREWGKVMQKLGLLNAINLSHLRTLAQAREMQITAYKKMLDGRDEPAPIILTRGTETTKINKDGSKTVSVSGQNPIHNPYMSVVNAQGNIIRITVGTIFGSYNAKGADDPKKTAADFLDND